MKHFLIVLAIICLIGGCSNNSGHKDLNTFQYLLGSWVMKIERGTITEEWVQLNDSTFNGSAYMTDSAGSVFPFEAIELKVRAGEIYYSPTVYGQNNDKPVEFKVSHSDVDGFTAENPNHDFPQTIIYKLNSPKELYARIEGNREGKFDKEEFLMQKMAN